MSEKMEEERKRILGGAGGGGRLEGARKTQQNRGRVGKKCLSQERGAPLHPHKG